MGTSRRNFLKQATLAAAAPLAGADAQSRAVADAENAREQAREHAGKTESAGAIASRVPAVNYLATKGFFASYNARPKDPLLLPAAESWSKSAIEIAAGVSDGDRRARRLAVRPRTGGEVRGSSFAEMLTHSNVSGNGWSRESVRAQMARQGLVSDAVMRRGDACLLIYRLLAVR